MNRLPAALLTILLLTLLAPAAALAGRGPDAGSAAAAIVVDGRNGDVMWAKRADERSSIASLTKLMTALLLLERANPRDVFTAPPYNAMPVESKIDLRTGERMTVRDMFEALMLESANDVAAAVAENISGSREAFVADMNTRAAELGLDDTSYANPIGFDDPDNYSTARDLAKLARILLAKRRFARVVDMPVAELESGDVPRVIDNRNTLIASTPWVTGVKTGHTLNAGYLLVGSARGRGGAEVISVVTGEPSEAARDEDTLRLLSWGLRQFRRVQVVNPRRALARAEIRYFDDDSVRLVPRRGVVVTVRRGEELGRRVRSSEELEGPLPRGTPAGRVTVTVDGEPVRRVSLVTAADVPDAGTLRVLLSELGVPLTLSICLAILLGATVVLLRLRARRRLVR